MQKLVIKNLVKNFASKEVLRGINLSVNQGESLVILGGSGSGKSVLLKIILGLTDYDSGEIVLNDQIITKKNLFGSLISKSGVLFQNNALFDSKNIYENLKNNSPKLI